MKTNNFSSQNKVVQKKASSGIRKACYIFFQMLQIFNQFFERISPYLHIDQWNPQRTYALFHIFDKDQNLTDGDFSKDLYTIQTRFFFRVKLKYTNLMTIQYRYLTKQQKIPPQSHFATSQTKFWAITCKLEHVYLNSVSGSEVPNKHLHRNVCASKKYKELKVKYQAF